MRGGGVSVSDELFRPHSVGGRLETNSVTTARRRRHVYRLEAEGDDAADGRQAHNLHRQFDHARRTNGGCSLLIVTRRVFSHAVGVCVSR